MISQLLLVLGPYAALMGALLLRRYPGERVLARMRARRRAPRLRPQPLCGGPSFVFVSPRGGDLIARAIAARPPPGPAPAV